MCEPARPQSVGPAKVLEELESYLSEPVIARNVPENPSLPHGKMVANSPLNYWKENQKRFPILSAIGRDAVSIAASSGSVERCFNIASDILNAKSNRMKPRLFADWMFVKCNQRYFK